MSPSTKRILREQLKKRFDYRIILRKCDWLPGAEVGWGCGYVCIPSGHPYHGRHYDDIPVYVHGGLTFGEHALDVSFRAIPSQYYVVGFDTAHCFDNPHNCPQSYVLSETISLRHQLKDLAKVKRPCS